ncbi:MAG TPA: TadE/TadG family type IV pilus assembly protein [Actinomycetes bacterium]|jgi:Flp pilus assembly pilin Flp|nr:TadE/TadG family type IV pilus assembly protein [Actinomycetes bacterium]
MGRRGQDGAAAVEFALLLPLLVLLLFGFIQFGIAFNTKIQATNAAREGARMAVVGIDNWANVGGGVSFWQAVQQDAGLGDIDNCVLDTADEVGGTLTVTFDYPLDLAIPFMPNPPSWQTGTATATMRIEQLSAPVGPGGC